MENLRTPPSPTDATGDPDPAAVVDAVPAPGGDSRPGLGLAPHRARHPHPFTGPPMTSPRPRLHRRYAWSRESSAPVAAGGATRPWSTASAALRACPRRGLEGTATPTALSRPASSRRWTSGTTAPNGRWSAPAWRPREGRPHDEQRWPRPAPRARPFRLPPHHAAPRLTWPNGARLAVYLGFNIEHFAFGDGLGANIGPASPQPDVLNHGWREYGNRVGAWRCSNCSTRSACRAAPLINTALYDHCPELVQACVARGDELIGHGHSNAERQGRLDEAARARAAGALPRTHAARERAARPRAGCRPGSPKACSRPTCWPRPATATR